MVVIGRRVERIQVSEMRREKIARPSMDGEAQAIAVIGEHIALAERLLHEEKRDEAALAQARAMLEELEELEELERVRALEDEWNSAVGAVPCMRIAPWKGNGHDGE